MRRLFALLMLQLLFCATGGNAAPRNPYPNELPGFKFYAPYLAPLLPDTSDRSSVASVLDSDGVRQLKDWRITPLFHGKENTVKGDPSAPDAVGNLFFVEMTPKNTVSMRDVKFPYAFTRSWGVFPETNVLFYVYEDSFGLEYRIYAKDTVTNKKGDLMLIRYGPSKRALSRSR
jgi:hypothetical protein